MTRVLKHATSCNHLRVKNAELWQEALTESAQGALGATIEAADLAAANSAGSGQLHGGEPVMKRAKVQTGLDVTKLRESGKEARDREQKLFQARVDHVIMRLICVRGLVPNLIDSAEWKELTNLLNGTYYPTSSDSFSNNIIPREAVLVRENMVNLLRGEENLTITFDGNTTRKPQALWTTHATTPVTRQSYFLDAHEGSDERHTALWVKDKVLKVQCNPLILYLRSS